MDRLRAMRQFIAVSEAGSLSAAARKLNEPLTTLSRVLAQLEAELGCVLLHRSTRRMTLTEEGNRYLDTCKRVIEMIDATEKGLAGQAAEPSGDLTITAPTQFGRLHLLPLVTEFLVRHPKINAHLLLVDRIVDLMDEGVDIALRIGELPDSALLARRVATLRLVTCAAPDYIARHGAPQSPADLSAHACVTFAGLPGGNRWQFRSRRHGSLRAIPAVRLSANTVDAVLGAAVAGVGITRVLSYQAEAALRAGQLVEVLGEHEDCEIPVHLVHRAIRPDSTRVRSFIDFAAPRLRTAFA